MKQIFTIACLLFLGINTSQGQVILAQWSFPTGNASDSIANGGIAANSNKAIRTEGGTSAIDFSKNGFTTKAAQATGWNEGADVKCWVVEITTTDYDNLKLSSKQQSGGNNPGPRDWKLQYKPGGSGSWADVPDAAYQVQNDWTTGILEAVDLPAECKNQSTLFLRWVMTSNNNSAGNPVEVSGINKIDDIIITGQLINTAVPEPGNNPALSVYPNPCTDRITVTSVERITTLEITDVSGHPLLKALTAATTCSLDLSGLPAGMYLIRATTERSSVITSRFFRVN